MYGSYSLMTFHVSCICLSPMPKSFNIFKIKFWHMLISYYFFQIVFLYLTFINLPSFNVPLCSHHYFSQDLSNSGFKLYSQNLDIHTTLICFSSNV